MKKPVQNSSNVVNRRAKFDYDLGDTLTVGIVLTGPEVRAVRDGRVQLKGAFVTLRNDELWLNNTSFSIKTNHPGEPGSHEVSSTPKKLLAKRREIKFLADKKQAGLSIVPLKIIGNSRYIKLIISVGKGKKRYDKRQVIKSRDQERENAREMKL
jgi:SsrA-binding protein